MYRDREGQRRQKDRKREKERERERALAVTLSSSVFVWQQKQQENEGALRQLPEHLKSLDSMTGDALQLALAKGLLAGNVFDWGAQEIRKLLETGNFSFFDAQKKLQGETEWGLCESCLVLSN